MDVLRLCRIQPIPETVLPQTDGIGTKGKTLYVGIGLEQCEFNLFGNMTVQSVIA